MLTELHSEDTGNVMLVLSNREPHCALGGGRPDVQFVQSAP